jgi:hypothetical protein
MSRPDLFLDSSALFAGVVSPSGAARALLLLAEVRRITVTVSEQVVTETERAVVQIGVAHRDTGGCPGLGTRAVDSGAGMTSMVWVR